jgi:hypothetical protein
LTGFIQGCLDVRGPLSHALGVMFPDTVASSLETVGMSPLLEAMHNSKGQKIPPEIYELLRLHMNSEHPDYFFCHYKDLPHPLNSLVLPPVAIPVTHIMHKG